MDWRSAYRDRLITPAESAALVKSGDLVRLPLGSVPASFTDALAARRDDLTGVVVQQAIPSVRYPWTTDKSWQESIRHVTDFVSPAIRRGVAANLVDFAVSDYSLGKKVLEDGRRDSWTADVFVALVSEPDEDGVVSFGYSLWHNKTLAKSAKLCIAEVGHDILRTGGDNFISISEFDYLIEQETAPPSPEDLVPRPPPDDEQYLIEAIGYHVSTLVRDRDTVQIGTGTVSSCMGAYLMERQDLGIDSEVIVPTAVELVKAGRASGRYKQVHQGKATGSFIAPGSDFGFVHDNPQFELYDIAEVNHVPRIANIDNLVAINNAGVIDLTGQVGAETWGERLWSGPGGQLVWTMGALLSRGGRAVTVLTSVTSDGTSRIVPQFEPGTVVTVPRTWVDFVVTEHGIANLQGKTQRERAQELIALADPEARDELQREARRLYWP